MSLEYSQRICPFWHCSLQGAITCSISSEVPFCSFNYARDKFLDCGIYLTEMEKIIKKKGVR